MYFCTHCKKSLINNYLRSALVEESNICYIACLDCNNVMKVSVKESFLEKQEDVLDHIQEIFPTSQEHNEETLKEIELAKSLFEKAGYGISYYKMAKPLYDQEETEEQEEKFDTTCCSGENHHCSINRKKQDSSCSCHPEIKKENKIIRFIKNLFGKSK